VQPESHVVGQSRRSRGLRLLDLGTQQGQALLQGLVEPFLFACCYVHDVVAARLDLRIGVAHELDRGVDQLGQDRFFSTQQAGLADRPAHHASEDVATLLVRRHHSVGDQEGQASAMVGDDAQPHVGPRVASVTGLG
jgi:hypothetical protein